MRINKFKALVRDDLEVVVIYFIIFFFVEESVNPASDLSWICIDFVVFFIKFDWSKCREWIRESPFFVCCMPFYLISLVSSNFNLLKIVTYILLSICWKLSRTFHFRYLRLHWLVNWYYFVWGSYVVEHFLLACRPVVSRILHHQMWLTKSWKRAGIWMFKSKFSLTMIWFMEYKGVFGTTHYLCIIKTKSLRPWRSFFLT